MMPQARPNKLSNLDPTAYQTHPILLWINIWWKKWKTYFSSKSSSRVF